MRPDFLKLIRESSPPSTEDNFTPSEGIDVNATYDSYVINPGSDSQYDVGLTPGMNVEEQRGTKQPWYDKLGNGLVNMIGTAGLSATESFAGLLYGIPRALAGGDANLLYNNELTSVLDGVEKQMKETFPFYQTTAEKNATMMERMGQANFWFDSGLGGLGYTLGSLAGGLGMTKMFGLTKAAANLKLREAVEAATTVGEQGVINAFGKLQRQTLGKQFAVGLIVGAGEASKEARETYKGLIEQGATHEEATALANVNYAANLFINGSINTAILGKLASPTVKDVVKRNATRVVEGQTVDATVGSTARKFLGAAASLKTGALEAAQEGSQFLTDASIDNYYQLSKDNPSASGAVLAIQALTEGMSETFGTKEGLENVIVGGLVGMLLGGTMNYMQDKESQAAQDENTRRYLDIINKSPEFQKQKDAFVALMNTSNTLQKASEAAEAGEAQISEALRTSALQSFAIYHVQNNSTDVLIDQLESMRTADPKTYKEFFGFSEQDEVTPERISQDISSALETVKKTKETYEAVTTLFPYSNYAKEDYAAVQGLRNQVTHHTLMAKEMDRKEGDASLRLSKSLSEMDLSSFSEEKRAELLEGTSYEAQKAKGGKDYRDRFNTAINKLLDATKGVDGFNTLKATQALADLNQAAFYREKYINSYNQLIKLRDSKNLKRSAQAGPPEETAKPVAPDSDEALIKNFEAQAMQKGYRIPGEDSDYHKDGVLVKVEFETGVERIYRVVKDNKTGKMYVVPAATFDRNTPTFNANYEFNAAYIRKFKPQVISGEEYFAWKNQERIKELSRVWSDSIERLQKSKEKDARQLERKIDLATERLIDWYNELDELTTLQELVADILDPNQSIPESAKLISLGTLANKVVTKAELLQHIQDVKNLIASHEELLTKYDEEMAALNDMLGVIDEVETLQLPQEILTEEVRKAKNYEDLVMNLYLRITKDLEEAGITPENMDEAVEELQEKIEAANEQIAHLKTQIEVLNQVLISNEGKSEFSEAIIKALKINNLYQGFVEVDGDIVRLRDNTRGKMQVFAASSIENIIDTLERNESELLSTFPYNRMAVLRHLKDYSKLYRAGEIYEKNSTTGEVEKKAQVVADLKQAIILSKQEIEELKQHAIMYHKVNLYKVIDANYYQIVNGIAEAAKVKPEKYPSKTQIEVISPPPGTGNITEPIEFSAESRIKRWDDIFSTSGSTLMRGEDGNVLTTNPHQLAWAEVMNSIPPNQVSKYKLGFIMPKNTALQNVPELKQAITDMIENMENPEKDLPTAIFTVLIDAQGNFVKDKNGKVVFNGYKLTENILPETLMESLSFTDKYRLSTFNSDTKLLYQLNDDKVAGDTVIKAFETNRTKDEWIDAVNASFLGQAKEYKAKYDNSRKAIETMANVGLNIPTVAITKMSRGIPIYNQNIGAQSILGTFGLKFTEDNLPDGWQIVLATRAGTDINGTLEELEPGKPYLVTPTGQIARLQNRTLSPDEVRTVVAILRAALPATTEVGGIIKSITYKDTYDAITGKKDKTPTKVNGKVRASKTMKLLPDKDNDALITRYIYWGTSDKASKGKILMKETTRTIVFMDPDNNFETEVEISAAELHDKSSERFKKLERFLASKYHNINKARLVKDKALETKQIWYQVPRVDANGYLTGDLDLYPSYHYYLTKGGANAPLVSYISQGPIKFANKYMKFPVKEDGTPEFSGQTTTASSTSVVGNSTLETITPGRYRVAFIVGEETEEKKPVKIIISVIKDANGLLNFDVNDAYQIANGKFVKILDEPQPERGVKSTTKQLAINALLFGNTVMTPKQFYELMELKSKEGVKPLLLSEEQSSTLDQAYAEFEAEYQASLNATPSTTATDPSAAAESSPDMNFKAEQPPVDFRKTSKDYVKGSYEEAVENLRRILGITPVQVKGLIDGYSFGRLKEDGTILLSDVLAKGTEYHEAFHRVYRWFLSPSERMSLIKEFKGRRDAKSLIAAKKEEYSELDENGLIEEVLAEEFREYALTGQRPVKPVQAGFFNKLMAFLRKLFGISSDKLFQNIMQGEYKNKKTTSNPLLGNADLRIKSTRYNYELTEQQTLDLVQSATYYWLNYVRSGEQGINDYYELLKNTRSLKDIYFTAYDPSKPLNTVARVIKDSLADEFALTGNPNAKNVLDAIALNSEGQIDRNATDFWDLLASVHLRYLGQFGLSSIKEEDIDNIDPTSDTFKAIFGEEIKDLAYSKSSMDYDPADSVRSSIRLVLNSIPALASVPSEEAIRNRDFSKVLPKKNSLGLPYPADYSSLFNTLGKGLAKTTPSFDSLLLRLDELVETQLYLNNKFKATELALLASRFRKVLETGTNTGKGFPKQVITDFLASFANTIYAPGTTLIDDTGNIYTIDSQSATNIARTISEWDARFKHIKGKGTDGDFRAKLVKENDVYKIAELFGIVTDIQSMTPIQTSAENTFTYGGIIAQLKQAVLNNPNEKLDNFYRNGGKTFKVDGFINALAERLSPVTENLQHFDGSQNLRYALSLPTAWTITADRMSEISKKLGNETDQTAFYEELDRVLPHVLHAGSEHSLILERLSKKEELFIGTAEDVKINIPGESAIANKQLHYMTKASQILNDTLDGRYHFVHTGSRPVSNTFHFRTKQLFIYAPGEASITAGTVENQMLEYLYGHLEDEIRTIVAIEDNELWQNVAHVQKSSAWRKLGYFQHLEKYKDSLIKALREDPDNGVRRFIDSNTSIKEAIRKNLEASFQRYFNFLKAEGLLIPFEDSQGNVQYLGLHASHNNKYGLEGAIKLSMYNQVVSYIEQSKIFVGNFNYFKNTAEVFKRFPMFNSTKHGIVEGLDNTIRALDEQSKMVINGTDVRYGKNGDYSTYSEIIFAEQKVSLLPQYLDAYRRVITKALSTQYSGETLRTEVDKYMEAFEGVEESDGLGYINIYAYRAMMMRISKWYPEHQKVFDKIVKGESITAEELTTFPMLKPQSASYYNPYSTLDEFRDLSTRDRVLIPAGRKTAYMLLIPQYFEKGSVLEKLHNEMIINGIDIVHYDSAAKYGIPVAPETGKAPSFYVTNPETGQYEFNSDKNTWVTSSVDARYLSIQQEVHADPEPKNIDSTQSRKQMLVNTYDQGQPINDTMREIVHHYKGVIDELVSRSLEDILAKLGATEFRNEFGLPIDTLVDTYYAISDLTAFQKVLLEAARERNSPSNVEESIRRLIKDAGELARYPGKNFIPLDGVVSKDKLEQILMSIVRNRVVFQKRKGNALPQSSVKGHEISSRIPGQNILFESGELKNYLPTENGTLPGECMIPLPKDILKWAMKSGQFSTVEEVLDTINSYIEVDEDGRYTNTSQDARFYQEFAIFKGLRIPNQSFASNDPLRVKKFLHPAVSTIVVPVGLIPKTGADFDIDKVFIYLKNYKLRDGQGPVIIGWRNSSPVDIIDNILYTPSGKLVEESSDLSRIIRNIEDKTIRGNLVNAYLNYIKDNNIYAIIKSLRSTTNVAIAGEIAQLNGQLEDLQKSIRSNKNNLDELELYLEESERIRKQINTSISERISELLNEDTEASLSSLITITEENRKDSAEKFIQTFTDIVRGYTPSNPNFWKSREALENELLDIEMELLTSPDTQIDLFLPTVVHRLKELVKNDKDYQQDNQLTTADLFDPVLHITKFRDFMGGDIGIGTVALHQTSHIRAQQVGLETYMTSYFNDHAGELGRILTVDGERISNILSMFLSSQVDMEKDPFARYIGLTPETLDLACYLVRRGVSLDVLRDFLKHPFIKAVTTEEAFQNSVLMRAMDYYRVEPGMTDENILKGINSTRKNDIHLGDRAILVKVLNKLNKGHINTKKAFPAIVDNMLTIELRYGEIDQDNLIDDILDSTADSDIVKVLNVYYKLKLQVKELKNLMAASNSDTQKDKNSQMSEAALELKKKVLEDGLFKNADLYFEDLLGSFQRARELQYNLGKETRLSGSGPYKDLIKTIRSFLTQTTDGKPYGSRKRIERTVTALENDFLLFLLTKDGIFGNRTIKDLMHGPNSVASRIRNIQDNKKHILNGNKFIQQVSPLIENAEMIDLTSTDNKVIKIDNLSLFRTSLTPEYIDILSSELEAIAEKDPQLYRDIILLDLYQSGLSSTPYSYRRLYGESTWSNFQYFSRESGSPTTIRNTIMRYSMATTFPYGEQFLREFALNHPEFLPSPLSKTNSPFRYSYRGRNIIHRDVGVYRPGVGNSIYFKQYDLSNEQTAKLFTPFTPKDDVTEVTVVDTTSEEPTYTTVTSGTFTQTSLFPYKGIRRVISGLQTGVDTLGLEVGESLGIETGGTAAPGYATESGTKEDLATRFNVVAISDQLQKGATGTEFWLPRTEQNVKNSDGTVYFTSSASSGGLIATRRFAKKHNKPFLLNPTAEELAKWAKENHVEILNIAGNRASKTTAKFLENVKKALRLGITQTREVESTTRYASMEEAIRILRLTPEEVTTLIEKNIVKIC